MPAMAAQLAPPPQDDDGATLTRLHDFFLSESAATEQGRDVEGEETLVLDPGDMETLLRRHLPDLDSRFDRTHRFPILELIQSTYWDGLPVFRENTTVQAQLIRSFRYIFSQIRQGGPCESQASRVILRLADAFSACQAVQGRVIDALYGELSGRDKGLPEQILSLADELKDRALVSAIIQEHPNAPTQDDANPHEQMPHLESAYRKALGPRLGLRGIAAARADRCAPPLGSDKCTRVLNHLRSSFLVSDLVDTIVNDVNQPDRQENPPERRIDRTVLCKWASQGANGFDPHSVFHDSDVREYPTEPEGPAARMEEPYLTTAVVTSMLACMFVSSKPAPAASAPEPAAPSSTSASKAKGNKKGKKGSRRQGK